MLLAAASYPASFLPPLLVPIVGLVFPLLASAFLFIYIEREDPTGV